jgi:hypothetical protein
LRHYLIVGRISLLKEILKDTVSTDRPQRTCFFGKVGASLVENINKIKMFQKVRALSSGHHLLGPCDVDGLKCSQLWVQHLLVVARNAFSISLLNMMLSIGV